MRELKQPATTQLSPIATDKYSDTTDLLTIVIPVYNEGKNFPRLWDEVTTQIKSPFHALVVYDMDDDDTVPIVKQYIERGESRITLLKNNVRRGVLGAIRTGFNQVESGPCLVIMADLSDDLAQVDKMVALHRKGYKVVAGSRYMPGGCVIAQPTFKQLLSRMAGMSLRFVRGVPTHDATNAFKLYDARLLRQIEIESQAGFELSLEITVKAFLLGYDIAEVPSSWRDRIEGESKFRLWAWLPSYIKWYLYAFRPRKKRTPGS
jgi:glycosyltransferase involved in cell wall biosynthesis